MTLSARQQDGNAVRAPAPGREALCASASRPAQITVVSLTASFAAPDRFASGRRASNKIQSAASGAGRTSRQEQGRYLAISKAPGY